MATIFYPDGRATWVSPRNGADFSLEELQAVVGIGAPPGYNHIEIVPMPDGHIMIVNEEGKLVGLPRNDLATRMAGLPTPEERARAIEEYRKLGYFVIEGMEPDEPDYIAGTVLVCEDKEVK